MNLPLYLVIMPLGFGGNTHFSLESDTLIAQAWLVINPLRPLPEGIRLLLLRAVKRDPTY